MQGATGSDHVDADGLETVEAWECAADCAAAILDQQTGETTSSAHVRHNSADGMGYHGSVRAWEGGGRADSGGASRFFYTAKASSSERNDGLHDLPKQKNVVPMVARVGVCSACGARGGQIAEAPCRKCGERAVEFIETTPHGKFGPMQNTHPTVKPVDLMRWLIRLLAPPGATILDPFAGSGTTGVAARAEQVRCVLIEREAEYLPIIAGRLSQLSLFSDA
jgi:ribosomal protein L40E